METLNEVDNAIEEMTDFEKKCRQYRNCPKCGCPTDEVEFENESCVDDDDFITTQFHWKDCPKNREYEPDYVGQGEDSQPNFN
jgi:hypothetical protein